MNLFKILALVGLLTAGCQSRVHPPVVLAPPTLIAGGKIWDAAPHNAFTDLIRYRGKWFCTFRESDGHVGRGDGKIRLLVSSDGTRWESAALLTESGVDLRDPKLSITPDQRLMLLAGGSVYAGGKLRGRQPRVAFSPDGRQWTSLQRVAAEGDWLWRVTWHQGQAYGIAYSDTGIKLLVSGNGRDYRLVTNLAVPGQPNEATLRFLPNGDCAALVRRDAGDKQAWVGRSSAPFRDWHWAPVGMQIGGPNFLVLEHAGMLASGRQYRNDKWADSKTFVGRMDPVTGAVQPDLILPSGGDCSYPGMVVYRGELWVSYYSSHEGRTGIYLARVKLGK